MKARAGWREKHEVVVSQDPLAQVSDAELEQMVSLLRNAIAEQTAIGHGGVCEAVQDSKYSGIGRQTAIIDAD